MAGKGSLFSLSDLLMVETQLLGREENGSHHLTELAAHCSQSAPTTRQDLIIQDRDDLGI